MRGTFNWWKGWATLCVGFAAQGCGAAGAAGVAPTIVKSPADIPPTAQKATFAAGCFWGVEARFRAIPGVLWTRVGYTGGAAREPTYQDVCGDGTGHAEAVEVTFDPRRVPYERLLEAFWSMHDPTTPNRQGVDVGSQYRSAIFYHSPEQEKAAREMKARLEASRRFRRPIVTEIVPAGDFWPAEDYHQQYLEKRGKQSCS